MASFAHESISRLALYTNSGYLRHSISIVNHTNIVYESCIKSEIFSCVDCRTALLDLIIMKVRVVTSIQHWSIACTCSSWQAFIVIMQLLMPALKGTYHNVTSTFQLLQCVVTECEWYQVENGEGQCLQDAWLLLMVTMETQELWRKISLLWELGPA